MIYSLFEKNYFMYIERLQRDSECSAAFNNYPFFLIPYAFCNKGCSILSSVYFALNENDAFCNKSCIIL